MAYTEETPLAHAQTQHHALMERVAPILASVAILLPSVGQETAQVTAMPKQSVENTLSRGSKPAH